MSRNRGAEPTAVRRREGGAGPPADRDATASADDGVHGLPGPGVRRSRGTGRPGAARRDPGAERPYAREPGPLVAAFEVTRAPVPWRRVWGTALTTSLAYLIGVATGHVEWGAWAFLGGLTSMYVLPQPYPARARRLLCVMLGMAAAMAIGSLSGTWWLMAPLLAVTGVAATLAAGMFRLPLPAGFLFILVSCVGAALPHPAREPARVLLVLAGGGIAWIVGMSGWPLRPQAPESQALRSAYRAVAAYLGGMSGEQALSRQNRAAAACAEAIAAAGAGSWRDPARARRARFLAARSETLLLHAVALAAEDPLPPPPTWREYVAGIGELADPRVRAAAAPAAERGGPRRLGLYRVATRTVEGLAAMPRTDERYPGRARDRAAGRAVRLRPSPSVAVSSLRTGLAVGLSVVLAHLLGVTHPYWVPLTCAAVLQGETVFTLTRRAVQRVVGTVVGLLLGAALLTGAGASAGVLGLMVAIVALQGLMLAFIARNYAVAVAFVTAFALLILHLSGAAQPLALIVARLRDTLLGVGVAAAATYLLWPRVSSRRLPAVLSELIARAGAVFAQAAERTAGGGSATAGDVPGEAGPDRRRPADVARGALQEAILRADTLARDALAEVPPPRTAAALLPCVFSAERIGYLLLAAAEVGQDLQADRGAREQTRTTFHTAAAAAARGGAAIPGARGMPVTVPEIWSPLARELGELARCCGAGAHGRGGRAPG